MLDSPVRSRELGTEALIARRLMTMSAVRSTTTLSMVVNVG